MQYVSELIGAPVRDPDGRVVGKSRRSPGTRRRGLSRRRRARPQASQGRARAMSHGRRCACSTTAASASRPISRQRPTFDPPPHELSLARQVLDHQIIDVNGVRVVRVNDLQLAEPTAVPAGRRRHLDRRPAASPRRGPRARRARRALHAQGHRLGSHRAGRVRRDGRQAQGVARGPGQAAPVGYRPDHLAARPAPRARSARHARRRGGGRHHRRGQPRPAGGARSAAWSPSARPTSSKRWSPTTPPTSSATSSPNARRTS